MDSEARLSQSTYSVPPLSLRVLPAERALIIAVANREQRTVSSLAREILVAGARARLAAAEQRQREACVHAVVEHPSMNDR